MSESLTWVKSSYSSTGNCVAVAGKPGQVLIRDTRDQSGPVLSISAETWRRFTGQLKRSLARITWPCHLRRRPRSSPISSATCE